MSELRARHTAARRSSAELSGRALRLSRSSLRRTPPLRPSSAGNKCPLAPACPRRSVTQTPFNPAAVSDAAPLPAALVPGTPSLFAYSLPAVPPGVPLWELEILLNASGRILPVRFYFYFSPSFFFLFSKTKRYVERAHRSEY